MPRGIDTLRDHSRAAEISLVGKVARRALVRKKASDRYEPAAGSFRTGGGQSTFTSMAFGMAFSFLGMCSVSIPLLYLAAILSASQASGRVKVRSKDP